LGKTSRPDGRKASTSTPASRLHQLLWHLASRHTKEIAQAIAEKIGPNRGQAAARSDCRPTAAFTVPGQAKAVWGMIEADLTEKRGHRYDGQMGPRGWSMMELCELSAADDRALLFSRSRNLPKRSTCFPFFDRRRMPAEQMLEKMGGTLVCKPASRRMRS